MPARSRPRRSRKSKRRPRRAGQQVIVIEPANPQVVYVPQYNPQVVYVQPADDGGRPGEQQHGCGRRGSDRFHGGHRDRRGRQQQLLLRSVRMARRGLHVQRRVGRLLRPPRGRARGLAGPSRGSRRGARRSRRATAQEERTERRSSAPSGRRATGNRADDEARQKPAGAAARRAQRGAGAPGDRVDGDDEGSARMSPAATVKPRIAPRTTTPERSGTKLGRILRLLERKVGARGQQPRTEQPKQLALERRRRREAAMTTLESARSPCP